MNIALIGGIVGAFLLVFRDGMWISIAVIAISAVLYLLDDSGQRRLATPPRRLQQAFQAPQYQAQPPQQDSQPGLSMNTADTLGNPVGKRQGPYVDGKDFSLPLPMGDLTNLVDVRHRTRVR